MMIDYDKNPMEDEVYSINKNTQCLEHGTYKGFNYYIMSYCSHPCCYIEIPESHEYYQRHPDDIYYDGSIECHGGLTYSGSSLSILKDSWFIGWDYAHFGDFSMRDYDVCGSSYGTKYSLDELRHDVYHAIDSL